MIQRRPIALVVAALALAPAPACTLALLGVVSGERAQDLCASAEPGADPERCPDSQAPVVEDGEVVGEEVAEVAEVDRDDEEDDQDGDGVLDRADECPAAPGPAPRGCPDSDSDFLLDPDDDCPTAPETRNDYRDGDGCPDELPAELAPYAGVVKGIHFMFDAAKIHPESRALLDGAAAALNRYPEQRVAVRVHSSTVGSNEYNLELTQRRADALVAYLVARGVDASRLEAEGVGEREPINCCSGPKVCGPHRSRRVEFKLLP